MTKYLTEIVVNERAKQIAARRGYDWSTLPTEDQALKQARFVAAAVSALHAEGYVNRRFKTWPLKHLSMV